MEENSPTTSAPQMRFGKIDDLSSRVAVGIDAARKYLFSGQHEDGYWCGELEADTTLEADYIILHTLLGSENRPRPQGSELYPGAPERGWRVEHLQRRSDQSQCLGEVLFWAEAGGLQRRFSCARARPENHSRTGRSDGSQHFHQALPLLLRTIRLRRGTGDSS